MSVMCSLSSAQSVFVLAFGLVALCSVPLTSQESRPVQDRGRVPLPIEVPVPSAANFDAWRGHILPTADELRWETIPWHQTFGEGLLDANKRGRPLLFYAMNGHPLGCT